MHVPAAVDWRCLFYEGGGITVQLRQYILSVMCCALICAIVPLFGGESEKQLLRLICGVFLTVTTLSQLLKVDMDAIVASIVPQQAYESAASEGVSMAKESLSQIIKAETEAYILDKAGEAGLDITVNVLLGEEETPLPAGVTIEGMVPPEKKEWLSQILSEDIGIPEEAQKWMG